MSDTNNLEIKNGNLIWNGSFEDLKRLISSTFDLNGKWSSPGGEVKLLKSDIATLKWYDPTRKTVIVPKDSDQQKILETLKDIARRNDRVDETNSQQQAPLSDSVIVEDMQIVDCLNSHLLDYTLDRVASPVQREASFDSHPSIDERVGRLESAVADIREMIEELLNQDKQQQIHQTSNYVNVAEENIALQEEINHLKVELGNAESRARAASEEVESLRKVLEIVVKEKKIVQESSDCSTHGKNYHTEVIHHPLGNISGHNSEAHLSGRSNVSKLHNATSNDLRSDGELPGPNQLHNSSNSSETPKHMVPCPFLRRRGFCLKGTKCDFSHDFSQPPVQGRQFQRQFQSPPFSHQPQVYPQQFSPLDLYPHPFTRYPLYPLLPRSIPYPPPLTEIPARPPRY